MDHIHFLSRHVLGDFSVESDGDSRKSLGIETKSIYVFETYVWLKWKHCLYTGKKSPPGYI